MTDTPFDPVRPSDLDLTADEIRHRWPNAIEYGPANDPYWDRTQIEDTVENTTEGEP